MMMFIFHENYGWFRNWVVGPPTCNPKAIPKPYLGMDANSYHKDINKIVHIVGGVTIGGDWRLFHELIL